MFAAAVAFAVANSPFAPSYFNLLKTYVGGLSVLHWSNDALMAVFFLLVELEIKREFLDGQLATWRHRALPGIAAAGGMIAPAMIYVVLNVGTLETLRGRSVRGRTNRRFPDDLAPSRWALPIGPPVRPGLRFTACPCFAASGSL